VRLVAVIRDPVDRAYSNWVHLRADGLEPEPDFLRAVSLEPERVARGFAPFWRYLELGRYGEQLAHLFQHVDPERMHVIRYRELIDDPARTVDGIADFLGVESSYRRPTPTAGRVSHRPTPCWGMPCVPVPPSGACPAAGVAPGAGTPRGGPAA